MSHISGKHPLRAAREAQNLTIDELAEEVKIGAKTIWNAENNRPISAKCRRLICEYFGKSSQELGLVNATSGKKTEKHHLPALTINATLDFTPPTLLEETVYPIRKHISHEERLHITQFLSTQFQSIWQQHISTCPSQLLATGQALLSIVQQTHFLLQPELRSLFFTGAYNVIGLSLHLSGYDDEAYAAHSKAYIAALEGNNAGSMAQTLICQANIDQARNQYAHAQQSIEAAIRLASHEKFEQDHEGSYRLQSHLFAINAQNAAFIDDRDRIRHNLSASEALLAYIPVRNEEFDTLAWHQYAGTCALIMDQPDVAIHELEQAIDGLPPQWLLRHAIVFIPLIIAYARKREQKAVQNAVQKAIPIIKAFNSPDLNRQLLKYLREDVQAMFPHNRPMNDWLIHIQQEL